MSNPDPSVPRRVRCPRWGKCGSTRAYRPSPLCTQEADIAKHGRQVRKVPILLQKSKIERLRKSRESRFLETLAAAILSGPIRRSVVVLVGSDVVPHVSAREAHQRSLKFSCFARKRLLQQYQGQSGKHMLALSFSAFDPYCRKSLLG